MIKKQIIQTGEDASVDVTSNRLDLGDLRYFSVGVVFDGGTLAGALTLEASNDETNWIEIDGTSEAVTAGANKMYDVRDASYQFVRVQWVHSSGTGSLSATAVIKENPIKGA